ncbi:MAG: hypothetical protein JSV11_00985, partial [Nitrospiraceae bacterium]
DPEECIKYADYVCTGEGERPVVSLLEFLSGDRNLPPAIRGIWTRRNGEIIQEAHDEPLEDLDSLPFQEYVPDYYYGFHKNRVYNFS